MINDLENYFQTHGDVALPGLGETMRLPRDVWFRDAGAVSSLPENLANTQLIVRDMITAKRSRLQRVLEWPMDKLLMMVAQDHFRQTNPDADDLTAYCAAFRVPHCRATAYELAIKKGPDLSAGIFAGGYASGEFLWATGEKQVLYNALEKENIGCPMPYRSVAPKYEGVDFADAAGLLALFRATRAGIKDIRVPTFRSRPEIKPQQVRAFGL